VIPRPTRLEFARNVCVILNGFSEAMNIAGPVRAWIHHNTLVGGGGLFVQSTDNDLLVDHNIIAFGNQGIEWFSIGGQLQLDCNDVFGNGQNYSGTGPGPTDFSADPLFCDRPSNDFHISSASPCAPIQAPCGLVGALPVQCGTTRAPNATWGGVKARYR
jgi:hypothetical protein